MLYLGLSVLPSLVLGDHVRELFLADLHTETCDSNAFNCFADGVAAGQFCTNDIEFVGVTHVENSCCYTYRSVYVAALDCEGKKTSQSHWTLSTQCPVDPTVSTAGLSKHVDASLCLDGIKFDSACSDVNGCEYTVCMQFPGEECCTDMGWVAVKSGNTYCVDEVEVPSCLCETPNPTEDPAKSPTQFPSTDPTASPSKSPTESPSKSPSDSPSESPTNFPSVSPSASPSKSPTESPTKAPSPAPSTSPTKNPTLEPTPNPSASPTGSPTPAPTPFCEPVVEIHVNGNCTADNFEAWDTNIVYAVIRQYSSLNEFEGGVAVTPQDALSQLIVGRTCSAEHVETGVDAQPLLAEPAAINDGESATSSDPKQKPMTFHLPAVLVDISHHSLLFIGLIVYAVLATTVAVYCWRKATKQRQQVNRMETYQIDSEAEEEEHEEEEKRDSKFML